MIRGGYKIVTDNNKWSEIADKTGLNSVDTNKLKEIYYKNLKPIEEAYHFFIVYNEVILIQFTLINWNKQ